MQFSIRDLLLLTFVVACLTMAAKLLAPDLGAVETAAISALWCTTLALASVWAILGSGRPILRGIVVAAIALVAAIVVGYLHAEILFWVSLIGLQAVLLVGSLGLIREAGYRFGARTSLE